MPEPLQQFYKLARKRPTLRASELAAHGIYRAQLSRLVAAGAIERVDRGLYSLPGHLPGEHASLIAVAQRAPGALFCLLTALRFHGLTTQAPFEVWIAIPNKAHPPRISSPKLRVIRFSSASLHAGVENHTVEGVTLRVTSVAKTVADCFKFRSKVGLDVAIEALRDAVRKKRATTDEIWQAARVCRVASVMRPYLESLSWPRIAHGRSARGFSTSRNRVAMTSISF